MSRLPSPADFALRAQWLAEDYARGTWPARIGGATLSAVDAPSLLAGTNRARSHPLVVVTSQSLTTSSSDVCLSGSFTLAWWGYVETGGVALRLDFETLYAQLSAVPEHESGDYWRPTPPGDQPWTDALCQWPHWWTWVVDGSVGSGTWTLYRDGVSLGTRTGRGVTSGACTGMMIGESSTIALAELDVFDGALTASQVAHLWQYARARYVAPATRDVWICLGDSEMEGRADPATAPAGYPPLDGSLWMLRAFTPVSYWDAYSELSEPCNVAGAYSSDLKGIGPAGLFGWLRAQRTGRETSALNCGHGGRRSSEQVYGGSYWHSNTLRIDAALRTPGTRLAGYVLYDGANDAVDASPAYADNWTATISAYVARYGLAPIVVTRLPTTVPSDGPYPSWESVRTQQAQLAVVLGALLVDAPEGPWIESYHLHLSAPGSLDVAGRWDAAIG